MYLPVMDELANHDKALTREEHFFSAYCEGRGVSYLLRRPAFNEVQTHGTGYNTQGHWLAPAHHHAATVIRDYLE